MASTELKINLLKKPPKFLAVSERQVLETLKLSIELPQYPTTDETGHRSEETRNAKAVKVIYVIHQEIDLLQPGLDPHWLAASTAPLLFLILRVAIQRSHCFLRPLCCRVWYAGDQLRQRHTDPLGNRQHFRTCFFQLVFLAALDFLNCLRFEHF